MINRCPRGKIKAARCLRLEILYHLSFSSLLWIVSLWLSLNAITCGRIKGFCLRAKSLQIDLTIPSYFFYYCKGPFNNLFTIIESFEKVLGYQSQNFEKLSRTFCGREHFSTWFPPCYIEQVTQFSCLGWPWY